MVIEEFNHVEYEMKDIDYKKQGKRNRRKGADFELKVRKHLMERGWIVSKWHNNIKDGKCVPAKPSQFKLMQTGFPDLIAYRAYGVGGRYDVKLIECKVAKYLKPEEKAKAQWYLKNKYCSCFYVAFKNKDKEIEFQKILDEQA